MPTAAPAACSTPVLAEAGVERLPGAHCYEVFAGRAAFAALADDEPGTFWLTDFLARNFERLVIRGLGHRPPSGAAGDLLRELHAGSSSSPRPTTRTCSRSPDEPPSGSASPSSTARPASPTSPRRSSTSPRGRSGRARARGGAN